MANNWGKVETVKDFVFLGSKIAADCDCSHEIQRCLFLGRKAMTTVESILKSKDITFGSVQSSCSVMSDYLRPHGLQHASFPVRHQLPELIQTYVRRVGDTMQPSHPLSSPSPPAFNLSQHQGLFK